MAFEDSYGTRLKKIITDPKRSLKKIIPFTKSRLFPYYRRLLASLHIFIDATPYHNHAALLRHMNKKNGFFVQCGGNDGHSNDPTYYLEKVLGWTGIIVEPLPIYTLCKINRGKSVVYNYAAGAFNCTEKTVTFVDCNAMSFVKGSIDDEAAWVKAGERTQDITAKSITVPLKPVQDAIDDYSKTRAQKTIDLFVADVEGYEINVLKGLDFDKNSPVCILLEIHTAQKLKEIEDYLKARKYVLVEAFRQQDYLFKLK